MREFCDTSVNKFVQALAPDDRARVALFSKSKLADKVVRIIVISNYDRLIVGSMAAACGWGCDNDADQKKR